MFINDIVSKKQQQNIAESKTNILKEASGLSGVYRDVAELNDLGLTLVEIAQRLGMSTREAEEILSDIQGAGNDSTYDTPETPVTENQGKRQTMNDYDAWRDEVSAQGGEVHPQRDRNRLVAQGWDGDTIGEFHMGTKQGYIISGEQGVAEGSEIAVDRKTGKVYMPNKELDKLLNQHKAQFQGMAAIEKAQAKKKTPEKQGVAEGSDQGDEHDLASLQKYFDPSVAYDAASHKPAMMQRKDLKGKTHHLVKQPSGKYKSGSTPNYTPDYDQMIRDVANSSAAPEHKKAVIDALMAKKKGLSESTDGLKPGDNIKITTIKGSTYTGVLSHINDNQSIVLNTMGTGGNPHAPDDITPRKHVVAIKMSHVATIEPIDAVTETSAQDKLHQQHQELRKKSGLPHPNYYKELKATFDLPDQERWAKVAELKKKYNITESDEDRQKYVINVQTGQVVDGPFDSIGEIPLRLMGYDGSHKIVSASELQNTQGMAEAKHFRTTYGWAGGRNEKTGGTHKHPDQTKADKAAKKAEKEKQSRDAFDGMFGGGNPADKLGIKRGVSEEPNYRLNDDDFYAYDPKTMEIQDSWGYKSVGRWHHEHVAQQNGWKVANGMAAKRIGLVPKSTGNAQGMTEDDFDDEESSDQGFFVAIGREDEGAFVGMVYKEGSKWKEQAIQGNPPHNWGTSYMGYLSPQDVMRWINKDYGRGAHVAGPFDSEEDAIQYAEYQFGMDDEQGVSEGVYEDIERYVEALGRAGYELQEEKVRLDPKCWKGKKIGNPKTKVKGGVRVNNCVPK